MSLTNGFYGANVDEKETEPVLRRALDLGITLINTADFYGPIANHELIGVTFMPPAFIKGPGSWNFNGSDYSCLLLGSF